MRVILAAVVALLGAGDALGQIRPHTANPSYWEYRGEPVLLVGASDRDNLFQWAGDGERLTRHLDLLAECGGNYVRCTLSSREYTEDGFCWDVLPYPFARVEGKYDLMEWNEQYWEKLRTFLAETKARGIIVQLEIWDRWNEAGNSERPGAGWYHSPWNPNNNRTYDWSDSPLLRRGRTDFYNAFHFAAMHGDPVLLPLQQRFVGRILDEVLDGGFDHVLLQIDNESGIGDESLEPDPYWARFLRDYARSKGAGHNVHVCTSRRFHWPAPYVTERFQDWENPEIRVPILDPAFTFCDISQNNGSSGQIHYDNLVWYRAKVRAHGPRPINHVKSYHFNWPVGGDFHQRTAGTDAETAARLWRVVFGGAASFRFHRPTSVGEIRDGIGLSPEARQHIRSVRRFLEQVDLFVMQPRNDLLRDRSEDEAYCLAEPGRQFAVFFTGAGNRVVRLDASAIDGTASLHWLDVAQGRVGPESSLPAAEWYTLSPPGPGHWVAMLTASE